MCVLYFKATFFCHDIFHDLLFIVLTFLFIISGTQYFENVLLMLLTSWYIFDFMTKRIFDFMPSFCIFLTFFFHHLGNKILWKRVFYVIDIMIYFCFYAKLLTSWQTFCHHVMFLMNFLTFWRHGKFVDVMICFWHHDELLIFFWQIVGHHDVFLTS